MTNQFGKRNRQFDSSDPNQPSPADKVRKPRIRPRVKRSRENAVETNANQERGFQEATDQNSPPEEGLDQKKRSIALVFDILIAFCIGLAASLVTSLFHLMLRAMLPNIALILSKELFIAAYFLLRDSLYQGRGLGKNLMGLRVVDVTTGEGPSYAQSIKRNIIFMVPFILQFTAQIIALLIPNNDIRFYLGEGIKIIGTLYVVIVLPLECYKAVFAPGGRRLGDTFAGTEVVESELNFSRPLK